MTSRPRSFPSRSLLSLLLAFFMCGVVLTVAAQDGAPEQALPAPSLTPPPRDVEADAPEREPSIRSRETLDDGRVQTELEIPAGADTYVASAQPDNNFGSNPSLFLGYNLSGGNNYGAQRPLLHFDVQDALPANATVHTATLQLYLNYATPDDDPMPTIVRRLVEPWDEGTVDWNNQPAWDDTARGSADVGTTLTWYEWEITELTGEWADGTHPNHGLVIIGDETVQERERSFFARETDGDNYPRLVVNYTEAADTTPPTATVAPLPAIVNSSTFTVSWSGDDGDGSGIAYYDVRYRFNGGAWTAWQQQTLATSASFTAMNDGYYEFEARAVDNEGNVEPFTGQPQASTIVDANPPFVEPISWLPIIFK